MNKETNKNCGIYCWTNKVNNKKYIGQSNNLKRRKKQFLSFNKLYCSYKYSNTSLIDNARIKYNSSEYWEYEILEYCFPEELNDREEMYIYFYNTTNRNLGYNILIGGKHHTGRKLTKEQCQAISKRNKGRKMSDEQKKILSIKAKERSEEIKANNKKMWLNEKYRKKMYQIHKGRKLSEESKQKIRNSNIGKKQSITTINKRVDKIRKPINQYDLEGNFIMSWKSSVDIEKELGFNHRCISNTCCKKIIKQQFGYLWRWRKNYDDNNNLVISNKLNDLKKPILQFNINGEFIKEWDCANRIQIELGFESSSIGRVCKGKQKTAYGFKWRYKTDYDSTDK